MYTPLHNTYVRTVYAVTEHACVCLRVEVKFIPTSTFQQIQSIQTAWNKRQAPSVTSILRGFEKAKGTSTHH